MYDRFLPAGKLHRQSREAREKGMTSRRSSSHYPPGTGTHFRSTTRGEFSVPSTDNVATGPNINVGDVNFKLKSSLVNMVQASLFCGKPNEDANAHLQNFLELCDTVVIRGDTVVIQGVAADVIKLWLFPFSLLGKAKHCFYKEKDIDTWAKCSKAFLAKFFPLGKTNALSTLTNDHFQRQLDQKIMRVCISYTHLYPIKSLNHTLPSRKCKLCF